MAIDLPRALLRMEALMLGLGVEDQAMAMRYLARRFGVDRRAVTVEERAQRAAAGRASATARSTARSTARQRAPSTGRPNGPSTAHPTEPVEISERPVASHAVVSPVVPVVLSPRTSSRKTGEPPATEPGVKVVIDAYHDEFLRRFGEKPNLTGKDGALVKGMVRRHGTEKVLDMMGRMFASADPFIAQTGPTLAILSSQWNKLAANGSGHGPNVPAAVRRSMEIARGE